MIVFITIPWFLPAFKAGGPVQSVANLVNNFDEGIKYRIFCGDTDLNRIPLEHIETGRWISYNKNTMVWYADRNNISKTITAQTALLKPDIIFIIGLFDYHFNIVPLFFCHAPKKILSVRGMLHPGALTQKPFKKKIFLNMLKLSGIRKKISFHATDEEEAGFIRTVFGTTAKIHVAGNYGKALRAAEPLYKEKGSLKLVTVALISPMKNYLAVLKALAACTGIIEYHIYGPVKDMEYWQLCLQQIAAMPENVRITYHGETSPEKVAEVLAENHVFIMPSKSENFGHAIYEALTAGKPVITGNATPWKELLQHRAGINTATEIADIKNAIWLFTEMNNEEYLSFCKGAVAYAKEKTDTEATAGEYRSMFFRDKATGKDHRPQTTDHGSL